MTIRPLLALGVFLVPFVSIEALARQMPSPGGWHAAYSAPGAEAAGLASNAAFVLRDQETVHPSIPARGFAVTYSAMLTAPAAGTYVFGVEAEGGDAEIHIERATGGELAQCATQGRDNATTSAITLATEPVSVRVIYKRGQGERARLRAMWSKSGADGFDLEPIPSWAVKLPPGKMEDVGGDMMHVLGRVMLQQKGCTNCHDTSPMTATVVGKRPAPRLETLGARANPAWAAHWLDTYARGQGKGDMPSVFQGDEPTRIAQAHDIAQFIASLANAPAVSQSVATDADIERGRTLFHTVGCIVCHGALESPLAVFHDPQFSDDVPEVKVPRAFGAIAGKWTRDGLTHLLQNPRATYPDGRMPSLDLPGPDVNALAAYLDATMARDIEPLVADATSVARGKTAFQSLGCASCHEVPNAASTRTAAKGITELDPTKGCLDANDATTPRYEFTPGEREALAAGLDAVKSAFGKVSPLDELRRGRMYNSCSACHAKDGVGGVNAALKPYFQTVDDRVDLGDEGRIPPDLTSVGYKLRTDWMERVLVDAARARPFMAVRMPQFGDATKRLAECFTASEGVLREDGGRAPASSDDLTQNGRTLAGAQGLNCVNCHNFKDFPSAGTPGPRLDQFHERLRFEWWRAYFPMPSRFKPGTRMPAFNLNGQTAVLGIYGGDWKQQSDALWSFMSQGDAMLPPVGIEPAGSLVLDPSHGPIVFRGFLASAGSKAVLVGTPAGVHFAIDSRACRLVEAWTGAFVDASGSWTGRGGMDLEGRGPIAWTAPAGPPLIIENKRGGADPAGWPTVTGKDAGWRFRGYHLDAAGLPTFLYDVNGVRVKERVEGVTKPALKFTRVFELEGLASEAQVWVNAGKGKVMWMDVNGMVVTQRKPSGEVWAALVPNGEPAGTLRFTVEVTP